MASLGWVASGAATDGCHHIFFLKKSDDFLAVVSSPLSSFHVVYLVFFLHLAIKN